MTTKTEEDDIYSVPVVSPVYQAPSSSTSGWLQQNQGLVDEVIGSLESRGAQSQVPVAPATQYGGRVQADDPQAPYQKKNGLIGLRTIAGAVSKIYGA